MFTYAIADLKLSLEMDPSATPNPNAPPVKLSSMIYICGGKSINE